MMFDTQSILILIALATAILGTLWQARPWAKSVIVLLALAAAGASILESKNKAIAKEKAIADIEAAKRNLELVLSAVEPPKIFERALDVALLNVSRKKGMYPRRTLIDERNDRVYVFSSLDSKSNVVGALVIGGTTRQSLFLRFAKQQSLEEGSEDLFTQKWGADDLYEDWFTIVDRVFLIATVPLGDRLGRGIKFTQKAVRQEKAISVGFELKDGRFMRNAIVFDTVFLEAMLELPPIERGRMIYEHASKSVDRL